MGYYKILYRLESACVLSRFVRNECVQSSDVLRTGTGTYRRLLLLLFSALWLFGGQDDRQTVYDTSTSY